MSLEILRRFVQVCVIFLIGGVASPSQAIDWEDIPGKDIVLFYPAQLSWEMLLTQSEHSGAQKFREGKNCRQCHEGEEKASGMLLAVDRSSDDALIEDKPGFIEATVKAAHDDDQIHINVRFDPGAQPDAGMDEDFATKIAVMLDDGSVADAGRAGCWATCHDNLSTMPSGATFETTKYLTRSRTQMSRQGSNTLKSESDLSTLRDDGQFLEYWQARLNPNAPPDVVDGFVLEERHQAETPLVTAQAAEEGGLWSVTFSRPLETEGLHKDFSAGKTYTLGLSIHAGHTAQRFHYVSLEKTLVIDSGSADFVARPINNP